MKEAMFYKKVSGKGVRCELCPRFCVIKDGRRGNCGVRENQGGKLFSLVYGRTIAANVDPIEKKPLFHFAPGSKCLSIATVGCNLHCSFCQNWDISQAERIFGRENPPEMTVGLAKENGIPGIAYTYTEPTIFFEHAYDTMKLARKEGLYNVWVSNGYTNPEPARKAAKYMDAINVDMKGDVKFYKKLCGVPNEKPVKEALKIYKSAGVWIEITNLVIPGFNDKKEQVTKLVKWIKDNLGDVPLHFSRFHPQHKMNDIRQTPEKTLEMCYDIARKMGMSWVYTGNVAGHKGESTMCPQCGRMLIERIGFEMLNFKKKCDKCRIEVSLGGQKWMKKK